MSVIFDTLRVPTVEHAYHGHPNVIINKCNQEWVYAFTLQDIVVGASQYVLSAVSS